MDITCKWWREDFKITSEMMVISNVFHCSIWPGINSSLIMVSTLSKATDSSRGATSQRINDCSSTFHIILQLIITEDYLSIPLGWHYSIDAWLLTYGSTLEPREEHKFLMLKCTSITLNHSKLWAYISFSCIAGLTSKHKFEFAWTTMKTVKIPKDQISNQWIKLLTNKL